MAFDRLVNFGAPSEKLRRLILFCKLVGSRDGFISLKSHLSLPKGISLF